MTCFYVGDGSTGGNEKGTTEAITDDDLRANVKVQICICICKMMITPSLLQSSSTSSSFIIIITTKSSSFQAF